MVPRRFTYPSPGFNHYWTHGRGKKILKKIPAVPARAEVEAYASLLMQSDALADTVITEVFDRFGFKDAHQMIETALDKGIAEVPDAPESLKQLLKQSNNKPEWLNEDLLNAGSDFCTRSGSFGLVVLRNYCLMGGYESSAINKPLIYTQALKKGAAKRMAETLEFWVDVTGPGAMQQGALGFKNCIKLRLMHAYARVSVERMPEWDTEQWGIPVNHGDMVATNLGFSLVFIHGLVSLGFRPSSEEVKGVFHLWKYIGHLIGIPAALLPDDERQAIESLYKWSISQPPADKDTIALAHALMDEPTLANFPRHRWQKKLLIKLHLAYNHYFLGNRACQTMALPIPRILRYYPYPVVVLNSLVEFCRVRNKRLYQVGIRMGRKEQVVIKTLFLKSHNKLEKAPNQPEPVNTH